MTLEPGERVAVIVMGLRKIGRERRRARKAVGSFGGAAEIIV
jgi:hypothetical protein